MEFLSVYLRGTFESFESLKMIYVYVAVNNDDDIKVLNYQ